MEQKILIFRLFILFFFLFFNNNILSSELIKGHAKIIDGDTIHIGKYKIRLHGIDAPEIKQTCTINEKKWNCGIKSKEYLIKFISNHIVNCKIIDKDRYNRLIGICFVNYKNINQYIVKNGWAIAYRYYSNDYIKEEEIAKKNQSGVWKGKFEEPYLFRKKNN
tara:strand:+ start:882 stop:1370 length:489 start_codon:yes stop_codon:yes gene_type:complete